MQQKAKNEGKLRLIMKKKFSACIQNLVKFYLIVVMKRKEQEGRRLLKHNEWRLKFRWEIFYHEEKSIVALRKESDFTLKLGCINALLFDIQSEKLF